MPTSTRARRSSYKPQKTAVLLAQRIAREILDEGLEPGAMLVPEREMLAKYDVGRGTLRESLRFLEIQGIVTIKPGPGGGPSVVFPDSGHFASTLRLLLQFAGTTFRSIVEARQVLEPSIAALAAANIREPQLDELAASVATMDANIGRLSTFLAENDRFHDVLAWSSGNPLFGYLVASLHSITDGSAVGVDYPKERQRAVVSAHSRIFDAVKNRDPEAAEAAMQEHIDQFSRYLERRYPQVMDERIYWENDGR